MSVNLKLPDERGEQLRMIADAKGMTLVQVIEDVIRREIEAGTIPADLPGITVTKSDDAVKITLPGFENSMYPDEAKALATAMREAAEKLIRPTIENKRKVVEAMGKLSGIKVERMANGVRLISPVTGQKYPLAFGVAADLADQIERETK